MKTNVNSENLFDSVILHENWKSWTTLKFEKKELTGYFKIETPKKASIDKQCFLVAN